MCTSIDNLYNKYVPLNQSKFVESLQVCETFTYKKKVESPSFFNSKPDNLFLVSKIKDE